MRMHRFTEPTPTSLTGRDVIHVVVADWEIECCAPPPVVGHTGTWGLRFVGGPDDTAGEHVLDQPHDWWATRYGAAEVMLARCGVLAYWEPASGAACRPGPVRLRGHLSGTVHGGIFPDDFPRVAGVVQRVQLITQRLMLDEVDGHRRQLAPVPGSLRLTDVQASPRWFTRRLPAVAGLEAAQDNDTGVLLDLAVPRSPRPDRDGD